MSRLPNFDHAFFDLGKLDRYCLSKDHPRGRHKARVFRQTLGIGADESAWLRNVILAALPDHDAVQVGLDEFGTRWQVDVPAARQGRTAVIRTIWIVRAGEAFPRFVTCWVT